MAHVSDLIAGDIEQYLESHERKSLLRFITCGSVDDGKSTLIGRLLYESKMLYRGSARRARGRFEEVRHAGRRPRLRAARRRPHRRARAGHHHRRRLPLLLDRQAQVHRRRHAGPRAIHAQHGDRRLDRGRRGDPDRCAQGRADADAPAQLPRLADRHPQGRAGHQQDGHGRLLARTCSTRIEREYRAFAQQIGLARRRLHSDVGAEGRQHHREPARTRRGTAARR